MIDINSLILPEDQQSTASLAASIKMARAAEKEGITKIIAAPNFHNNQAWNHSINISRTVEFMNEKLKEEGIDVELFPGQENRLHGDMVDELQKGEILSLNNSRYVFIELPDVIPSFTTDVLFYVGRLGYIPVIVHPEKNLELLRTPDKLYRMINNGALAQVNAASLIGKAGKQSERFTHQLLEANLAHFVASGEDYDKRKGFYMKEAYRQLKKEYDNAFTQQLQSNNAALIYNDPIYRDAPERISTKKKWGLFR